MLVYLCQSQVAGDRRATQLNTALERSAELNEFLLWTIKHVFVYNRVMPRQPPPVFPQEQRLLSQFGERLKLARMRRKLSNAVVAQRAGISRTSLYKVETGHPGATLGTYFRVLAVLGLEGDINVLAADDKLGRKLQDLALVPSPSSPRRRSTASKANAELSPAASSAPTDASP
jgi:transcriptional regulator with XRE-family HTH domain